MRVKGQWVLVCLICLGLGLSSLAWAQEEPAAPAPEKGWPKFSFGPIMGGGGIIGISTRMGLAEKISLGLSGLYRPAIVVGTGPYGESTTLTGAALMIPIEFVIWFSDRPQGSKGPRRHGLQLAAGQSFGDYPENMFALSWDYERYARRKHIFNTGIGLAYIGLTAQGEQSVKEDLADEWGIDSSDVEVTSSEVGGLYWKFAWRW